VIGGEIKKTLSTRTSRVRDEVLDYN